MCKTPFYSSPVYSCGQISARMGICPLGYTSELIHYVYIVSSNNKNDKD